VNDARYVKFWKNVCGDGKDFHSVVETGGKKFVSPWATLGFKGLLKALIVTTTPADAGEEEDMQFLEMQEALEDYVSHHGLFEQAQAAARLATRLPWLIKYKFVDKLPQSVHSIDLLRGLHTTEGALPLEDITFKLPPRFIIGTLLITGHLLETRYNHWRTKNFADELELAQISAGAAGRKSFHRWELRNQAATSPWDTEEMTEVDQVGQFLGYMPFSKRGDPKARNPGLNTSYWEAAILGSVPGTAAHTVLSSQKPYTSTVGATVISVSSGWFAKIRACDLFGDRVFKTPYNDFPFRDERIDSTFLNETEKRVAFAQKALPTFELVKIQFGRYRPTSPMQHMMMSLVPEFPSMGGRAGLRKWGTFGQQYLSRAPLNDILFPRGVYLFHEETHGDARKFEDGKRTDGTGESVGTDGDDGSESADNNAISTESDVEGNEIDTIHADIDTVRKYIADGWMPTESEVSGDVIATPGGNNSAFHAFIAAMKLSGNDVSLETVVEVAEKGGWDKNIFANFHELGILAAHFDVEIILQTGVSGAFRFPERAKYPQQARIGLVCLGDKFGWLPERCKGKGSKRKGVRFAEMEK
jgi:hypothetical protein